MTAVPPASDSMSLKRLVRAVTPLALRKRAAIVLQRQEWIPAYRRNWWSFELVRDVAERDLDAFHEFLWTNHLAYAESYEVDRRFGPENMRESRRQFFSDLVQQLAVRGVARQDVRSVLEVGCSLGYQLRYLETNLFSACNELRGIDIDRRAIDTGAQYLRTCGSKVSLAVGGLDDVERLPGPERFDIVVATGVLMYVNEERATRAMAALLRRTRCVLALAGLAHPVCDNAQLRSSDMRERDRTFIHNFDRMIADAGGRVIGRRWEGSRIVDGNTIYFVFAVPH
jgi:SAM-dependent methyltransferase